MRTFVICCLLAFPVAAQDAVTDAPVVKVRVELAEPVVAPRVSAAAVKPVAIERVSVPSSREAIESKAVSAKIAASAVEVYAKLYTATAKNVPPERLLELRSEWYQIFIARGGSKMWWILTKARELAERGEPVDRLKAAFDATLSAWMAEEE